jgi:hypothetical protein
VGEPAQELGGLGSQTLVSTSCSLNHLHDTSRGTQTTAGTMPVSEIDGRARPPTLGPFQEESAMDTRKFGAPAYQFDFNDRVDRESHAVEDTGGRPSEPTRMAQGSVG